MVKEGIMQDLIVKVWMCYLYGFLRENIFETGSPGQVYFALAGTSWQKQDLQPLQANSQQISK